MEIWRIVGEVLIVRAAVKLICALFAAALLFVFVRASTRGWTGVHIFDDDVLYRRGWIATFPGSPADEAKIPRVYPIPSMSMKTGKTATAMIPLRGMETKTLRPEEAPPPGMLPTAPPILPGWTYTDDARSELYHEIDPEDLRTGDAIWIFFSNNQRGLLHVRSPLRTQTGILLFGFAAGVAFFNLIVPLMAWQKQPRAKETILFLAIGILVCTTVLSLPLTLLEFFRGVDTDSDWIIAVPAIAFMTVVAALLHLAYVFPHHRLPPEKRYLLLWLYLPAAIDFTTPLLATVTETPFAMFAGWLHVRVEWIGIVMSVVLLVVAALLPRARRFRLKRALMALLILVAADHLCGAAFSFTLSDYGAPPIIVSLAVTLVNALYLLACLLGAAGLLISNYRRATTPERRQLKSLTLGVMATIVACILLLASGKASLQLLSVDAHIVLLTTLLCIFPWTLNLAITRHRLFGIDRLFSPASSVIVFFCVWALGEIAKDGSRLFIEHLLGERHVEVVELTLRLLICLAFARVNVEKLFGMEVAKTEAPREEERITGASDEATALEIATRRIAGELGAKGYAAFARTATFGPLTLVTKSEAFSDGAEATTFRRHVAHGRSGEADQRKLKTIGAEVTLDVAEKKERFALLVFTGVSNHNAESPSIVTILAALKWRLRYTPADPQSEAVTA